MQRIELTHSEREAGEMPEAKRDQAVHALQEEGFVGLENAIDPGICDHVLDGMMRDLDWLDRHFGPLPRKGPDGHGNGRLAAVNPPLRREHVYREMLYNPFAIAVTHAMLGGPGMGVHNANYVANWSFPLRPEQRGAEALEQCKNKGVHGDTGPLFPSLSEPEPAFMMNLTIPLMDFTEENGATEIWPGTHRCKPQLADAADDAEHDRMLEQRRAEWPPERMEARKGTVVLRDPRAWHAAKPNLTDGHRVMIGMRHHPVWMAINAKNRYTGKKEPLTMSFEPETADLFGHEVLEHHVEFVEGADRHRLLDQLDRNVPEAIK